MGEHIKAKGYLNFNKNKEKLEYIFTLNRVFKHKEVISNQYVCTIDLGKM